MLMMRLQRIGRRNEAHFKIVVIEKTKGPKSQKYIDIIGSYNPKMGTVQMNEVLAKEWLSKGVQPSDTVYNMLVDKGIVEGRKKNVLPKKSPVIDEEAIAKEKAEKEATEKAKLDAEAAAQAQEEVVENETPQEAVQETETTEEAPEAIVDAVDEATKNEA